jgi:hypothetical protein
MLSNYRILANYRIFADYRILGRRIFVLGAALAVAVPVMALAQAIPGQHPAGSPAGPEMMRQHNRQGVTPGAHPGMHAGTEASTLPAPTMPAPTMPGQDAFGAIQEIVRILEADPKTDWSKVALEPLRQHLIDMNEVTLGAAAAATETGGGLRIAVTGSGRTLAAIQRMVPAHAAALNGLNGWSATAAAAPDGVLLTVTARDPKEVQHIRGLGFIGLMASGGHHQPHHLAMARGEFSDTH